MAYTLLVKQAITINVGELGGSRWHLLGQMFEEDDHPGMINWYIGDAEVYWFHVEFRRAQILNGNGTRD